MSSAAVVVGTLSNIMLHSYVTLDREWLEESAEREQLGESGKNDQEIDLYGATAACWWFTFVIKSFDQVKC